ncbi:PH domain-containing protein [Haloarcula sp. H-GB5]
MDGEVVLENRHPGWGLWWKFLGAAGFLFLIMLGSGELGGIFFGLLIAGAIVGYVAFARSQSRFIVTDERIKMDLGFIRSQSREYRISDVQGLDTSQGIIAKLFGIGDIQVRTADGTTITWVGVPDHDAVATVIREQQRQFDASMDRK